MNNGLRVKTSMPQVVILAGGLGTRLGKLTESTPKSLINVDNQPIITHILDWIASQDCNRVLLLTGHLGVMFDDYQHDAVINSGKRGKPTRYRWCVMECSRLFRR